MDEDKDEEEGEKMMTLIAWTFVGGTEEHERS